MMARKVVLMLVSLMLCAASMAVADDPSPIPAAPITGWCAWDEVLKDNKLSANAGANDDHIAVDGPGGVAAYYEYRGRSLDSFVYAVTGVAAEGECTSLLPSEDSELFNLAVACAQWVIENAYDVVSPGRASQGSNNPPGCPTP